MIDTEQKPYSIPSNDGSFGCPTIRTDTYLRCFFSSKQKLLANWTSIFGDNC